MQFKWALSRAIELGVAVDASIEDLQEMQRQGLSSYKSLRIDDAISGDVMDRAGFRALIDDAVRDKSVSHIFVYRRDRLARPEDAMTMTSLELRVREKGVSIVLTDKIAGPRIRGQADFGDDVTTWIDYHQSREFLKHLAERVINGQCNTARQGNWTGGRPPYGFIRILVDSNGKELEELLDGRRVRQEGCHVRIKPKDLKKIEVWLLILDWKSQGLGAKRIAALLNGRSIPSPDAGRTRTDQGVKHRVTGKWGHRTVLDLCRNATIIGVSAFGRRSEGKHRRFSPEGPRVLEDRDRLDEERLRLVNNDPSTWICAPSGKAQFDADRWQAIQTDLDQRGATQRGIPRTKDLSKYPLSCRVVDLTDDCGAIMYGRENGKRRIYVCGRYLRTSGAECESNTVDAEALLMLGMLHLRNNVDRAFARGKIRERLFAIAERQSGGNLHDEHELELARLRAERKDWEEKIATAGMNLALVTDDFERDAVRAALTSLKMKIEAIDTQLRQMESRQVVEQPVENDVDAAMELLARMQTIATEQSQRLEWYETFRSLNLRVGLRFANGVKGKKRVVRKLSGGMFVLGDEPLPVPLHGKDCIPAEPETNQKSAAINDKAPSSHLLEGASDLPFGRREGVSFTKVSRGDRN